MQGGVACDHDFGADPMDRASWPPAAPAAAIPGGGGGSPTDQPLGRGACAKKSSERNRSPEKRIGRDGKSSGLGLHRAYFPPWRWWGSVSSGGENNSRCNSRHSR